MLWCNQCCDIDIIKDMYNCIILFGGNSMFSGLPERLTKEIKALANDSMKEEVKVIASPERKFASWIGGSIVSVISTFESFWLLKGNMKNKELLLFIENASKINNY